MAAFQSGFPAITGSKAHSEAKVLCVRRKPMVGFLGLALMLLPFLALDLACASSGLPAPVHVTIVAPTITTQPADQSVLVGKQATFEVVASGTTPLTYAWKKNGTAITGATSPSYTTSTLALADSGTTFTVTVTNSAGSVTSRDAKVTVTAKPVAPTIVSQPQNQSVKQPQRATFTVLATGTEPLKYQWSKGGAVIDGATSASYTTPDTQDSDNGTTFAVTVSNDIGSVTSNSALLTLTSSVNAPVISTNPRSQTIHSGQDVTFTVVASGTSPMTYQWVKDGSNIGANSPNLTITSAKLSDGGSYSVVVSNASGSATSKGAVLVVNPSGPVSVFAGVASTATIKAPNGVVVDGTNNLYITDSGNGTIRKITPDGSMTTVAGSVGTFGSKDGTGADASFTYPAGIARDTAGNLYVADPGNQTIRKITPAGVVTTYAGQPDKIGCDNGQNTAATFAYPYGLALDSQGNLYVADSGNNVIRKITPAGVVSTYAGTPGPSGNANGKGTAARFNNPSGIAIDGSDSLFVTDSGNNTIRKITADTTVSTLAGTAGTIGSKDGTASAASFDFPFGISVDASGNLFVADYGTHILRKITSAGVVTTFAGSAGASGNTDATGSAARFTYPAGTAVSTTGNIYVADSGNDVIRKVTSASVVTSLVGGSRTIGTDNATGTSARFYDPRGIRVDGSGNLFLADAGNHTIRQITTAGAATTFAGTPGSSGMVNATGTAAKFSNPQGLCVDSAGNIYVADTDNNLIRKITSAGVVTTVAGKSGIIGHDDGTGTEASFYWPTGVAVDASGNLYVADKGNHTIRKITSSGVVSTLAGIAGTTGSVNGSGSSATFNGPSDVVVDSSNNVYVTDTGNHIIRKITSDGIVSTFAGLAATPGSADGISSQARFFQPLGLAIDSHGNLYVADQRNDTLRKVTSGGIVTTLAGVPGDAQNNFGPLPSSFSLPTGICADSTGNVYVTVEDAVLLIQF